MEAVGRVVKVVLLLLVAFVTVTLVIALVGADTGPVEKGVLVVLIAGCVALAWRIPAWTDAAIRRLHAH